MRRSIADRRPTHAVRRPERGAERRPVLEEALAGLDVDVACLQEVWDADDITANAGNITPELEALCISTGMTAAQVGTVQDIISGQIMLVIPYEKALELVDLLMENPPGTTQTLGSFERSALAEVGNQTGTFFINSLSSLTGLDVRPSPPAVMVDMVGAILDIIVATTGGVSEHVLLMQANFKLGDRKVETNFWVIPDESTLEAIKLGES